MLSWWGLITTHKNVRDNFSLGYVFLKIRNKKKKNISVIVGILNFKILKYQNSYRSWSGSDVNI